MSRSRHIIYEEASGEEFCCGNAETILAAATRSGIRIIMVGCRNGGCGLCKIRILEGEYRTGKMSRAHISKLEEKDGYALACRTTPITSLKIKSYRRIADPLTLLSKK